MANVGSYRRAPRRTTHAQVSGYSVTRALCGSRERLLKASRVRDYVTCPACLKIIIERLEQRKAG